MQIEQTRRRILTKISVAALSAAGGLAGARLGGERRSLAAEPPPEITTVTLEKDPPAICIAPDTSPRVCFGLRGLPISGTGRGMRIRLWSWRTIRSIGPLWLCRT